MSPQLLLSRSLGDYSKALIVEQTQQCSLSPILHRPQYSTTSSFSRLHIFPPVYFFARSRDYCSWETDPLTPLPQLWLKWSSVEAERDFPLSQEKRHVISRALFPTMSPGTFYVCGCVCFLIRSSEGRICQAYTMVSISLDLELRQYCLALQRLTWSGCWHLV